MLEQNADKSDIFPYLNEDDMEKHLSWMLPRIRKSKPKVNSGSRLAGWYVPAGALRFMLPYNTSVVDCEEGWGGAGDVRELMFGGKGALPGWVPAGKAVATFVDGCSI